MPINEVLESFHRFCCEYRPSPSLPLFLDVAVPVSSTLFAAPRSVDAGTPVDCEAYECLYTQLLQSCCTSLPSQHPQWIVEAQGGWWQSTDERSFLQPPHISLDIPSIIRQSIGPIKIAWKEMEQKWDLVQDPINKMNQDKLRSMHISTLFK